MRSLLFIALLAAVACAGCGKKLPDALKPLEDVGSRVGGALKQAKEPDEILYVRNKINAFHRTEGRYPSSLDELVEKSYVTSLPQAPAGKQLAYDPATGKIEVR